MKWTVKLVTEVVSGNPIEHEIAMIERAEQISPASVGQSAAGKSTETNRYGAGGTARGQGQVLSAMRYGVANEGLLSVHAAFCIQSRRHTYPATARMPLLGIADAQFLDAVHKQEP